MTLCCLPSVPRNPFRLIDCSQRLRHKQGDSVSYGLT